MKIKKYKDMRMEGERILKFSLLMLMITASLCCISGEAEAQNEVVDSWDITSFANSPEKINALQLQVKNTDSGTKRKTSVDHVYAVVEWNWPTRRQEPIAPEVEYEIEEELVPIR